VVHLTKTYKNSILCSTARLTRHFTWLVILPILQTFANELAWKQSCWQDEHVCHGVLEANGDEHRNREPNSHHFAREVLPCPMQGKMSCTADAWGLKIDLDTKLRFPSNI
jgi:hypothetical protein